MTDATPPLISAVIPTRGRPALVTRAIRSALTQTYANVEVVVVVDGPDEATLQKLETLADPRLRVIALSENVGGSEARNVGVRCARGNWIALLDDDDEWLPEKLAKQMRLAVDRAASPCLLTCRRLERKPGFPDIVAPHRTLRSGENTSEYMFYSEDKKRHTCGPQTSSFFGTREVFLEVPFSKGLKCHQDWDWYLRVMNNGALVRVMMDEPLYIMYVEADRPRLTQIARWDYSLNWIESRKDLFTARAYTSFLINECMYRCEETIGRARIFRRLFESCRKTTRLRTRDLVAVVKWYLFRPSIRLRLRQFHRGLQEGRIGKLALGTQPMKPEVHG